jgi:glycosyltransferase involved in cell wall biosynthesis
MNIGFFVWEYFPRLIGGLGTYAVEITKKFKEFKNNINVFTINDGNLKTREVIEGIEVHRPLLIDAGDIFPMFVIDDLKKWGSNIKFFSDVYVYNLLSATKFVNDLVRKNKTNFDLVCIHDWLSAVSGFLIKKELPNLPLVFHIHSIEEQRSPGSSSEVIKHFERRMAGCANKIITVSNSMKDFLVSIGYPADKIEVVYNGCDPEKYDPSKVNKKKIEELRERYKIKEDEKVILFVGRLVAVKGVYNLLSAMLQVLKEYPHVKLIILGKGEQYDDLVAYSQVNKISEKVVIRSEWVSEEERIAHYAMADVCVFPSISEPFGIVSLEAMSMKKPVVVGASGINGLKEQVIPSGARKTGVHVDGNKPEDIAWGIKEVLKNPDEARKWGENGRKRVLKEFTWEITARKTLKIYEELIK